jgi:hypothetical protein
VILTNGATVRMPMVSKTKYVRLTEDYISIQNMLNNRPPPVEKKVVHKVAKKKKKRSDDDDDDDNDDSSAGTSDKE